MANATPMRIITGRYSPDDCTVAFPRDLHPTIASNLRDRRYFTFKHMQETLYTKLKNSSPHNVAITAPSGSGKTLGVLIGMMNQRMHVVQGASPQARYPVLATRRNGTTYPTILVIEPTEQHARHAGRFATMLASGSALKIGEAIGGFARESYVRSLANGADIVIGTPWHIQDFVGAGMINLSDLQYVILDEADQLISICEHRLHILLESRNTSSTYNTLILSSSLSWANETKLCQLLCNSVMWQMTSGPDAVAALGLRPPGNASTFGGMIIHRPTPNVVSQIRLPARRRFQPRGGAIRRLRR